MQVALWITHNLKWPSVVRFWNRLLTEHHVLSAGFAFTPEFLWDALVKAVRYADGKTFTQTLKSMDSGRMFVQTGLRNLARQQGRS